MQLACDVITSYVLDCSQFDIKITFVTEVRDEVRNKCTSVTAFMAIVVGVAFFWLVDIIPIKELKDNLKLFATS